MYWVNSFHSIHEWSITFFLKQVKETELSSSLLKITHAYLLAYLQRMITYYCRDQGWQIKGLKSCTFTKTFPQSLLQKSVHSCVLDITVQLFYVCAVLVVKKIRTCVSKTKNPRLFPMLRKETSLMLETQQELQQRQRQLMEPLPSFAPFHYSFSVQTKNSDSDGPTKKEIVLSDLLVSIKVDFHFCWA